MSILTFNIIRAFNIQVLLLSVVGLQPTVIASRAPHLLLEQSVMTKNLGRRMTKNRGRASPVNTIRSGKKGNLKYKFNVSLRSSNNKAWEPLMSYLRHCSDRARPPEVPKKAPYLVCSCRGDTRPARGSKLTTNASLQVQARRTVSLEREQ